MRVAREAGAHEDVEHVVHVALGLVRRQSGVAAECPRQVRVTAVMILRAAEEELRVGIAARADDVVNAAAVGVEAVPVECVVRDRGERPQVRQRAPQPVAGRHMGCVQRARFAGEEALAEVVCIPQVQIADLRSLDADDSKQMAGRHLEGARLARRHDGFGNLGEIAPHVVVERAVVGRELVDGVDDNGWRCTPRGCIGGWLALGVRSHSVVSGV